MYPYDLEKLGRIEHEERVTRNLRVNVGERQPGWLLQPVSQSVRGLQNKVAAVNAQVKRYVAPPGTSREDARATSEHRQALLS